MQLKYFSQKTSYCNVMKTVNLLSHRTGNTQKCDILGEMSKKKKQYYTDGPKQLCTDKEITFE